MNNHSEPLTPGLILTFEGGKYYSTGEAARLTGLSPFYVSRLCANGEIPGVAIRQNKTRNVYLVPVEWVDKKNKTACETVSVAEAAEMAGVSKPAIYQAVRYGYIQKTGTRLDKKTLKLYIEKRGIAC